MRRKPKTVLILQAQYAEPGQPTALSDGLKNSGKGHVFSMHPLPWIVVLSYSVPHLQEHWGKTLHIPIFLPCYCTCMTGSFSPAQGSEKTGYHFLSGQQSLENPFLAPSEVAFHTSSTIFDNIMAEWLLNPSWHHGKFSE